MKIFIKAKPSAKNESVEKLGDYNFAVSVKEPPKDGRANKAIIKALAEYFKVSPFSIRLISGFSSKQKVFEINHIN